MRRSADFEATVRHGARAGRGALVVHCRVTSDPEGRTRVGLVVSRAVGGAVVRNKVRRRLRGVVVEQRGSLPAGADVVVRALPPSSTAEYSSLTDDFRSALRSAARRAGVEPVVAGDARGAGR